MLTESGYVHRSEDVCYWVQLSLHLLLKAIVFSRELYDTAQLRLSEKRSIRQKRPPSPRWEYIDTQALARASEMAANPQALTRRNQSHMERSAT